jgi:DNA-binding transcriptional LysR family regulator
MGLSGQVSLKGGQVFDTLELGMIAAARGYGISMGDLLMVAEDVAQGRLSLPFPRGGQRRKLLFGLAQNPARRRALAPPE